jgi:membrane protein
MLASLSDWRKVAWETLSCWDEHDAMTQSAALAFYTLFSLAPVLIVVISVAGAVFGADAVRGRIVQEFAGLMGEQQASAIQTILRAVTTQKSAGLARVIGIGTLIVGATAVFVQLQNSLNVVWEVHPKPGHVFRTLLKKRLVSLALVLAIGFLLAVSLAASAALNALQTYAASRLSISAGLLEGFNTLLSFAAFTLLFEMIFRILPDVDIPWRDVWLGSVITSLLFSIGKYLIGLYLGRTTIASPYGAAASVVVILFWVYYASLILLLGAEFTRVYSRRAFGSRRRAMAGAERVHTVEVPGRSE